MNSVEIHTDGACVNNPGVGAWAAVLRYGNHEKGISGYDMATTNNRMEITGVIQALRCLTRPCTVEVFTDSMYVLLVYRKWSKHHDGQLWTSTKLPPKNPDLIHDLLVAAAPHNVTITWVKGHSGNKYNEICDRVCSDLAWKMHNQAKKQRLVTV